MKSANLKISRSKIFSPRECFPSNYIGLKIRDPQSKIGNAFTLIELLVVVAIISILACLLLPALSKAKDMGWKIDCLNNLKQNCLVLNYYSTDYDGWYPEKVKYDQPNITIGNSWIYDYYSGTSYKNLLKCSGTRIRPGFAEATYKPVNVSGNTCWTSYVFYCGTATYPSSSTHYWYGWLADNNSYTPTSTRLSAPCPQIQFLGRTTGDPISGNQNYVADPSIAPMIMDISNPTVANTPYYSNHSSGQNTAYMDGHGAFLFKGEIRERYASYVYW